MLCAAPGCRQPHPSESRAHIAHSLARRARIRRAAELSHTSTRDALTSVGWLSLRPRVQWSRRHRSRFSAVLYRLRFEAKPHAVRFVPFEPCGSCVVSGLRFGLYDTKSSSVGWRWGRSRGGSGRRWNQTSGMVHAEWAGRRGVLIVGVGGGPECHPMDQMGQWGGGEGCTRVVAVASQKRKKKIKKIKNKQKRTKGSKV